MTDIGLGTPQSTLYQLEQKGKGWWRGIGWRVGKEGGEVSRSQVGGVENKRGWLRHRGGDELKQTGEANDHPAGQQGAAKRGGGIVSETSVRPV